MLSARAKEALHVWRGLAQVRQRLKEQALAESVNSSNAPRYRTTASQSRMTTAPRSRRTASQSRTTAQARLVELDKGLAALSKKRIRCDSIFDALAAQAPIARPKLWPKDLVEASALGRRLATEPWYRRPHGNSRGEFPGAIVFHRKGAHGTPKGRSQEGPRRTRSTSQVRCHA